MEGQKERLGLDLDGVIYPWQEVVYDHMKYFHNETRNFHDFWRDATEKVFTTKMGEFWLTNNLFYVQRNIRPDILDTLNCLSQFYDLFYITSRVKSAQRATRYWFKVNNLPRKEYLYFSGSEKLPLVLEHEVGYFVEDRIKHILELRNYTNTILIRQPWNEEIWDEVTTLDSVILLPELLGVGNGQA